MKKLIFIILLLIFTTSCDNLISTKSYYVKYLNQEADVVRLPGYVGILCFDGVEYFYYDGRLSAHWKKDGTLYTCEE
jgi:hypothetical protein